MYYILYKITNLLNNKFYIGVHSTSNIDDNYMGSGKAITSAIKKYGIFNFKKDIIETFDNKDSMYLRESEIVTSELVANKLCYNQKRGGFGGWGKYERTSEHNKASSIRQTGIKRPYNCGENNPAKRSAVREKISASKKIDNPAKRPEVRKKMSLAKLGKPKIRCSCIICKKLVTQNTLYQHIKAKH